MNFATALTLVTLGFLFSLFVDIGTAFRVEWFLFGLDFKIDFITKSFAFFSSFVWLMSAIYSHFTIRTQIKRYWFWFILTFAGNYGLIISHDILGFYLFFSLMSLAAFGLVIHTQTQGEKEAAFLYIKYAILGEVALFIAIIISVSHYGGFTFELFKTSMPPLALGLFIFGFGIKGGLFLLHFWLPPAHANAPAAASATLSGVMLKAGILGLIRVLPFGDTVENLGGIALCSLGVAGIYFGLFGLLKSKLKEILAYSSISQMGYLFILLGYGLLEPTLWETLLGVVIFFSIHHAINKSSLFFLAGEVMHCGLTKHFILLGSLFALSLVGVAFSSGGMAKEMLLASLKSAPLITLLLSPSIFVTALLMLKLAWIAKEIPAQIPKSNFALYILYPMALLSLALTFY
ncbi:MAG: proton-conducting transporter membrane subunit [Sulfuricurvum sp.]|nr:proton-conducting transporter membrane subunit [Sulfuricurvum sp.]